MRTWSPFAGKLQAWLRGLDSNQDNQIQSLVCYQIAPPRSSDFLGSC
jgi:hypothetical protein